MLMTLPPRPPAIMALAANLVARNAPVRWVSSICRHSSWLMSRKPDRPPMPALLTRTSTRPYVLAAPSITDAMASSSRTSAATTSPRTPSSCRKLAFFASSRPVPTTKAPAPSSPRAMVRPSPLLAPVTTATWPASENRPPSTAGASAGVLDWSVIVIRPSLSRLRPPCSMLVARQAPPTPAGVLSQHDLRGVGRYRDRYRQPKPWRRRKAAPDPSVPRRAGNVHFGLLLDPGFDKSSGRIVIPQHVCCQQLTVDR